MVTKLRIRTRLQVGLMANLMAQARPELDIESSGSPRAQKSLVRSTSSQLSLLLFQKMAITLAQQLISHLEAKIAAMPNDPDKFLMSTKLKEHSDILRVRFCFVILIETYCLDYFAECLIIGLRPFSPRLFTEGRLSSNLAVLKKLILLIPLSPGIKIETKNSCRSKYVSCQCTRDK